MLFTRPASPAALSGRLEFFTSCESVNQNWLLQSPLAPELSRSQKRKIKTLLTTSLNMTLYLDWR